MAAAGKNAFQQQWGRYLFNLRGYNKYGLRKDDFIRETPIVQEALRRLPKQVQDERTYRSLRAVQANINQTILPKEQWTKFEEDVSYLDPYIAEVEKEEKEKAEWYRTH
ncbi:ubiquinol-cytochrome c reductase complex 14 kDa-like [Tropilaelaps mercedesae]|uniref:Cytochrome b-c1 complex subunit 7 n=1 Tax=Tropilaelaps mercedesae TaxID=418985 RepID=A0A1V9X144_9ACAR|nr:ubiquinol-cytochrome c reductase complex 14 kDa-like [Tropilaelaps mercedesae]